MKMTKREPPRLARNVTPLFDYVELYLRDLRIWETLGVEPSHSGMEGLRRYSLGLARHVLKSAATDMERSAGSGIREAVSLMLDPDYYKKQTVSRRERAANRADKMETERLERERILQQGYTRAQIATKARMIESMKKYRDEWIAKELEELANMRKNPAVEAATV